MPGDVRREIILAVSRGELTPEEAAARLEAAETQALPPPPQAALPPPPPPPAAPGNLTAVRVDSDFGSVRIYGDASVAGAVADGPHSAEQDGSTLVIRGDWTGTGGFIFGRGRRFRINTGSNASLDRINVRMNPRLALELAVKAGDVRVDGVEGPISADLWAGEIRIDGFRSPINLSVKAGEIRARGLLDHGESRIECQAGEVRLDLERGSSVRVRARASLGNIDLDDGNEGAVVGGGGQERVIGGGAGTLDIQASLGSVRVAAQK